MQFSTNNMQEVFREYIKEDYTEIAQRIKKSIQEKKRNINTIPFGYDLVEGVPIVNEDGKIVKWIYERYLSYSENPPIEMIEIALKRAKEQGEIQEDPSYEEAKYLVNDGLVKKYIAEELSLKVLYHQVISEKLSSVGIDDILSLPLEDIPRNELTSLMTDISKKTHENHRFIGRALKEEFYSGIIKYRKSNDSLKGTRTYEEQFIVVEEHHEPIISPEMFRAAQEATKTQK